MGLIHDTHYQKVILQAYGNPVTNLSTANFSIEGRPFAIKNDNDESVSLEVKYLDSDAFVATKFLPGWNPDIVVEIKSTASVSNLLYTE